MAEQQMTTDRDVAPSPSAAASCSPFAELEMNGIVPREALDGPPERARERAAQLLARAPQESGSYVFWVRGHAVVATRRSLHAVGRAHPGCSGTGGGHDPAAGTSGGQLARAGLWGAGGGGRAADVRPVPRRLGGNELTAWVAVSVRIVEARVPLARSWVQSGAMEAGDRLRQMVNGYQMAQALHVAAMLGISDLLAAGPRTVADLATAAGADPDALGSGQRKSGEMWPLRFRTRWAIGMTAEGIRFDEWSRADPEQRMSADELADELAALLSDDREG